MSFGWLLGLCGSEDGGWVPDIFTFGKVIGGGGAHAAGKREVMEYPAPVGPSTRLVRLPGNPLSVAAVLRLDPG